MAYHTILSKVMLVCVIMLLEVFMHCSLQKKINILGMPIV